MATTKSLLDTMTLGPEEIADLASEGELTGCLIQALRFAKSITPREIMEEEKSDDPQVVTELTP